MKAFRKAPKSPVAEVPDRAEAPKPRWPLDLLAAGYSDEEIVRFAITMPFADVPGQGVPYHEQGRAALTRILAARSPSRTEREAE